MGAGFGEGGGWQLRGHSRERGPSPCWRGPEAEPRHSLAAMWQRECGVSSLSGTKGDPKPELQPFTAAPAQPDACFKFWAVPCRLHGSWVWIWALLGPQISEGHIGHPPAFSPHSCQARKAGFFCPLSESPEEGPQARGEGGSWGCGCRGDSTLQAESKHPGGGSRCWASDPSPPTASRPRRLSYTRSATLAYGQPGHGEPPPACLGPPAHPRAPHAVLEWSLFMAAWASVSSSVKWGMRHTACLLGDVRLE